MSLFKALPSDILLPYKHEKSFLCAFQQCELMSPFRCKQSKRMICVKYCAFQSSFLAGNLSYWINVRCEVARATEVLCKEGRTFQLFKLAISPVNSKVVGNA